MNFGYINGAGGGRTGVSIGEPGRAVKILDSATDAEKAKALRELADMYDPPPTHTLDAEPGPEPSVRRPLAAAEWQCVASALGLAVAMLESNSPEVIRAAQALAVSKVHELRS